MLNATTARPTDTVTCELCGRTLDRALAKTVPVVGFVGSTCYQRVGAVADVLEQNGLGALTNGPVRVTLADLREGRDPLPRDARERAYKLGLLLRNTTEEDDDGTITAATFWLEVRAGKRLRRVLTA